MQQHWDMELVERLTPALLEKMRKHIVTALFRWPENLLDPWLKDFEDEGDYLALMYFYDFYKDDDGVVIWDAVNRFTKTLKEVQSGHKSCVTCGKEGAELCCSKCRARSYCNSDC